MIKDLFTCEICKCKTPREFEGGDKNVCANCVPQWWKFAENYYYEKQNKDY